MQYQHDPKTGKHQLLESYSETVMGITITRHAGYFWHVGKWPFLIRNPSKPMRIASFVHDGFYEDFSWTWVMLLVADTIFVVVYLREGGKSFNASIIWFLLRFWSILTIFFRTKP